jgi:recombination protein RecT
MGWKGYVQLAQRTGQYSRINVVKVYESQFKGFNALHEELDADFNIQPTGKVVGYAAYFRLVNGYEKTVYWTIEQVQEHGQRFSQSFNGNSSPWKSDFDAMAMKTVLKHTLSKWGILSIEMQKATTVDQAVVTDYETEQIEYVDAGNAMPTITETEIEQAVEEIESGNTTADEISTLFELSDEQIEMLKSKEPKK